MRQKIVRVNARVLQRAFERGAVNFVVKGKDDFAAVGVFQLDVAAATMHFDKAQAFQCGSHFAARQQEQFHIASSKTSALALASISTGSGSR